MTRSLAVLALVLAGCPRVGHKVAGNYRSTWGAAVVAQSSGEVVIAYPRGSMHCDANGDELRCNWQSEATKGRAKLRRNPDRTISGTWGHESSDDDGGQWVLTPE